MYARLISALRRFPVYPLLFSTYPLLYLWGANRAQQSAYVIVRPLLITLLLAVLLYGLLVLLVRNTARAAFATFLIGLYLSTYGHLSNALSSIGLALRFFYMPLGLMVVLFLTAWLVRRFSFRRAAAVLNPVGLVLVLLAVIPTGYYYLINANRKISPAAPDTAPAPIDAVNRPDVYLIIMDGYSRADWFQTRFHFDNTGFIDALKQRGFLFPNCAQSNYPATAPAIASILNMNYLDALGLPHQDVLNEKGSEKLGPYIQDNQTFQQFRALGYKLVTFRGFLSLIDLQDVDTYITLEEDVNFTQRIEAENFEDLYLRTTALNKYKSIVQALRKIAPKKFLKYFPVEERFEKRRQENIYAIESLQAMPKTVDGPKLVYAHLYASHWPYVLKPDGSPRLPYSEAETDAGYLDGVRYLNQHMLAVIDSIMKDSKIPPVIILQSDHGYPEAEGKPDWSGENRLKNFSAFYLPGGGDTLLTDTITPVNNFRLVLRYYLNTGIDLLPDVSYFVDPTNGVVKQATASCMSQP